MMVLMLLLMLMLLLLLLLLLMLLLLMLMLPPEIGRSFFASKPGNENQKWKTCFRFWRSNDFFSLPFNVNNGNDSNDSNDSNDDDDNNVNNVNDDEDGGSNSLAFDLDQKWLCFKKTGPDKSLIGSDSFRPSTRARATLCQLNPNMQGTKGPALAKR